MPTVNLVPTYLVITNINAEIRKIRKLVLVKRLTGKRILLCAFDLKKKELCLLLCINKVYKTKVMALFEFLFLKEKYHEGRCVSRC